MSSGPIALLEAAQSARAREKERAERVRKAHDVTLPRLTTWNYEPCEHHEVPTPGCEYRACGGELFRHQRVGAAWLYLVKQGLLADYTGLGKTEQALFALCLMKERGELKRALVVCQAAAVPQWAAEIARWAPGLRAETATGTPRERSAKYAMEWDVLVASWHVLLRDHQRFTSMGFQVVIPDDVDPIRTWQTKTAKALRKIADRAESVYLMNATPVQVRLMELYNTLFLVGGYDVFGFGRQFQKRYIRMEAVMGRNGMVYGHKEAGYKNMRELREKMAPLVLRRSYDDVDDVRVPSVAPPTEVWLDLHPAQRARYQELQQGVLRILAEDGGVHVQHKDALAKVNHGAQICAGLQAIGDPDGPEASVKIDWIMDKVTGEWAGEKIVVFSRFIGTTRALAMRLRAEGVGVAMIWGPERDPKFREQEVTRFWEDPNCRVMIGTSAIERSLNLQVSRVVVFLDTLLNPSRMTQILGRVRRVGSKHSRVFPITLLARDTQEQEYLRVLERRQAMTDAVWNEVSDLYKQLSTVELLRLIAP